MSTCLSFSQRERLTEDFMMPDYLAEEHRECDHDPVEEITMPSLHETASMAVTPFPDFCAPGWYLDERQDIPNWNIQKKPWNL